MTRQKPASLIRDQKGAALIEFAFAFPVLMLFVFGTLQIGLVMQSNSALREVVGWAGREAMVSYQDTSDGVYSAETIKSMILAKAADDGHRLKANNLTVNVTVTDDNVLLAKKIALVASYDIDMTIPFWRTQAITLNQNRTFYVPKG